MKKENKILTAQMKIAGNIMTWNTSALQLSNISNISTVPIEVSAFPFWAILVFFTGLCIFEINKLIGIALLVFASVSIISWFCEKAEKKKRRNLIIIMNSGTIFTFLFYNQHFLVSVYRVLLSIIANAGKEDIHVNIDMSNSTISGNANILNDLNIG